MLKTSELPRLTNFLRAYSDVSATWAITQDDPNDVAEKRKDIYDHQTRIHSLDMVTDYLCLNSVLTGDEIKKILQDLLALAKNIVGSDAPIKEIEGAAIYLIDVLRDCDSIGNAQISKLRHFFGVCEKHDAQSALVLVKRIVKGLKVEVAEKFLQFGFPQFVNNPLENEEFGSKLKYHDFQELDDSFYLFPFDSVCDKNGGTFEKLSFNFNASANSVPNVIKNDNAAAKEQRFDYNWLHLQISSSFAHCDRPDVLITDLVNTVITLLKSQKSSNELENELFELLGFDQYELLQVILLHRNSLAATNIKPNVEAAPPPPGRNNHENGPSCMRQVTIQSESEKWLNKQLRKDEKRIQKLQSAKSNNNFEADEFDPRHLKFARQLQLEEAQNAPLFSNPSRGYVSRQAYPNVYDMYAEVSMSASYISGRKLNIPANSKRTDNAVFEEICIPSVPRVAENIIEELVPISALDPVGRKAFSGMESLNLIQSKVFNIAYNTNENMLVCAPTGAGKTNVAMLTIVHEIRNNMEQGIVQKDKFKIVYVAPMKALASEMVLNFSKRLKVLGITVKELTGDMQLTKNEIKHTQILVTTPEKWDVVTRKATGDVALSQLVKLLILDEVHLLDGDRGAVLEAIVARTLRQVETSQSMIRILGLSATLPNYIDVSRFLRVNPMVGLFFFDDRFRPVPLSPTFIGIKSSNPNQQIRDMNDVCYTKVVYLVQKGHQVMVFVHSRNATVSTALALIALATEKGQSHIFQEQYQTKEFGLAQRQMAKSRNKELRKIFDDGFAIHHAGMLRMDRNHVEKYFREGLIKVLVCTSTLAWGVNLPARAVIIKGTEIYDSKHGAFVPLGVLDVMQIFGRAGRPQYDKKGQGVIITTHNMLTHYLSLLTRQHQIESQFEKNLADNLNAEIGLGTVTNVDEGVEWLSYTYLYVRMMSNPHAYGLKPQMLQDDVQLLNHRKSLIQTAAKALDKAKMVRFEPRTGYLYITDLGRTASHFYISCGTVERFQEKLRKDFMQDNEIIELVSIAEEFDQLKVRADELVELDRYLHSCQLPVRGGVESSQGKVNVLLQLYLSRMMLESFSLISDQAYIIQNSTRILRFLFEAALRNGWSMRAAGFLRMCKMFEKQQWHFNTPLRQFSDMSRLDLERIEKNRNVDFDHMMELDTDEIAITFKVQERKLVRKCLNEIPIIDIIPKVQPITDRILRLTLYIRPKFKWNDKVHGSGSEAFWIWIEDPDTDFIYQFEYFLLPKNQVESGEEQSLIILIPLGHGQYPSQYLVRVISDRWLGSDQTFPVDFQKLILPHHRQPLTKLLDLHPLPVVALHEPQFQQLYNFEYFNPIQTQVFHTLYHTDHNVLLGAPTGSGKTIAAEIAMFRVFRLSPKSKVVYIAPLKALVRERIEDWKVRFAETLKKNVIELTGDVTPDARAIANADIIVTTPEKWDGVSRSWQTRNYVQATALMVIDEIHLLGESRGPVLEVIVSRTNFISGHTDKKVRIVGLSTALANAQDLASWLHISEVGLYNFAPSVRPVPLEVHVSGYPGKHYCPRMALMNKPTYQAIRSHSPEKPALIFVSSRRQTRLTALDLIAYLAAEDNPRQWLSLSDEDIQRYITIVRDQNLKLTLAFGIGLHHAGLHEKDRKLVEQLFLDQKIQVLIATSTLAWGVNLPAHLVVIKGTEYYDGKTKRYIDFPITDVLQMMGRAGRPQFDTQGVAVVLVQDIKKNFYKKFLYEPFPVESSLIDVLPDHLNAEVVSGTISSKQQCLDYITWTYFFRRLLQNPGYYGLESCEPRMIDFYLSDLINKCLKILYETNCITFDEVDQGIESTVLGRIASYYYLSHKTLYMFRTHLVKSVDMDKMLWILCEATEYDELPVRHNEDGLNEGLAKECRIEVNRHTYDNPHTKTNLLLQAHFSQLKLPCTDYYTDLKSVLDQAIRIMQAIIDVASDKGWLSATISAMLLLQMTLQGCWYDDNTLLTLPYVKEQHLNLFQTLKDVVVANTRAVTKEWQTISSLPELISSVGGRNELLHVVLRDTFEEKEINEIFTVLTSLPMLTIKCSLKGLVNGEHKVMAVRFQKPISQIKSSYRIDLHADQQYTLNVNLKRLGKPRRDHKALTPKFPKQKDEGWFLVLGIVDTGELVAMKRIPFVSRESSHQIVFYTAEEAASVNYRLFVISDSYVGLDQQYDIYVNIINKIDSDESNSESDSDESIFISDEEDGLEST